jgi:hypothetical protein
MSGILEHVGSNNKLKYQDVTFWLNLLIYIHV